MDDLTEEKARQMDAGSELNRICAEWMGWSYFAGMGGHQWKLEASGSTRPIIHQGKDPPPFSTDWSAAGPLLEAMNLDMFKHPQASGIWGDGEGRWICRVSFPTEERFAHGEEVYRYLEVSAPTPQLAIARACAVLVARGVSRDDLEEL